MANIITPSRYISLQSDFLRRIFSLMGNILSFILDRPQKSAKHVFLKTDSINLKINMAYRGENMLVIDSKCLSGCRVLLSRRDLMTLQNMEIRIVEAIVYKNNYTSNKSMSIQKIKRLY